MGLICSLVLPLLLLCWEAGDSWSFTGADRGFLLVRLRVASMEDLTEPTETERLVEQLQCELQSHVPHAHLSLLRIQRS
ncbi:mucin-20 isoform X3 [Cavia porcellus]|uniref:mucin-20 isoform X3 n=1 Tax=Cavia porcellus TaxID=10141 RepID=UPI0006618FC4|nr:mucin-20 isoform X3 [Cavia porcellus]